MQLNTVISMAEDTDSLVSYNTYSHNFGILIPQDTDVVFTHQDGGMSCTQLDLEGVFLPMKRPTLYQDPPEWRPSPGRANPLSLSEEGTPNTVEDFLEWVDEYDRTLDGVDVDALSDEDIPHEIDEFIDWTENTLGLGRKDISDVDLTSDEIPDRDFESFPEWVQERGHFYDYDEYRYWLNQDEVYWYGHLDLIEEQRLWNYDPSGDLHEKFRGYDPTDNWESLSEIWDAIDACLPFIYEEYDHWETTREALADGIPRDDIETPVPEGYPEHGAAFKWIQIKGSKVDKRGRRTAPWADALADEYVMLTYDNVD